jgi:hypothetical protein
MKMPATILAGLLFVVVALVLYSMGVWGAFQRKGASKRDLKMLWTGFAFDVFATLMMSIQVTSAVQANLAANASYYIATLALGTTTLVLINNLKTYIALLGMLGMLIGTILATRTFARHEDARAGRLSRVLLAPWALWVIAFVFGLIESAPKR